MVNLSEENLDSIDWQDSKNLFAFGVETVKIAGDYQAERKRFAENLKKLKLALADCYNHNAIERKISEDKAYLILADRYLPLREALMNLIDAENQYKGLEKVLETRQAVMSLAQSLIKNRIDST